MLNVDLFNCSILPLVYDICCKLVCVLAMYDAPSISYIHCSGRKIYSGTCVFIVASLI